MITRVVMQDRDRCHGSPQNAERLLVDALSQMPPDAKTKFLITPGGFVYGQFPVSWRAKTGWKSPTRAPLLIEDARLVVENTITPRVIKLAKGRVDIITLCVDLRDYVSPYSMPGRHVELIAAYDVASEKVAGWTGKSYPVPSQEKELVHIRNLNSHLMNLAGEKVMILGCHDLNMWNPRGWANQRADSDRRKRCWMMRRLAERFQPTVVLQHPHDTDSPNIWTLGWAGIKTHFPNLKAWTSAICYNNENGGKQRATLENVLRRTKSDFVSDIVVN